MKNLSDLFTTAFPDLPASLNHKIKYRRREESADTDENTTTIEVSVLESINTKLAILELLQDIEDLKTSLELSELRSPS